MAIGSILDSIAWADDEFSTSVIEGIVLLARDDRERERRGDRSFRLRDDVFSRGNVCLRSCARSINYLGDERRWHLPLIRFSATATKNSAYAFERGGAIAVTCSKIQTEKIELPWNKFNGGG